MHREVTRLHQALQSRIVFPSPVVVAEVVAVLVVVMEKVQVVTGAG